MDLFNFSHQVLSNLSIGLVSKKLSDSEAAFTPFNLNSVHWFCLRRMTTMILLLDTRRRLVRAKIYLFGFVINQVERRCTKDMEPTGGSGL